MNIKFVKSYSVNPDNVLGYEVWSDEHSSQMNLVGYISNKNLPDMKDYFEKEGYAVEVVKQFVFG